MTPRAFPNYIQPELLFVAAMVVSFYASLCSEALTASFWFDKHSGFHCIIDCVSSQVFLAFDWISSTPFLYFMNYFDAMLLVALANTFSAVLTLRVGIHPFYASFGVSPVTVLLFNCLFVLLIILSSIPLPMVSSQLTPYAKSCGRLGSYFRLRMVFRSTRFALPSLLMKAGFWFRFSAVRAATKRHVRSFQGGLHT